MVCMHFLIIYMHKYRCSKMKGKVVFILISLAQKHLLTCLHSHALPPMRITALVHIADWKFSGCSCMPLCMLLWTWSENTEIIFNLSMMFKNAVSVNQEKKKNSCTVQCVCKLPIGNLPFTTAGLLHPTLLAAETLKTNSSQFCTTPPCGAL